MTEEHAPKLTVVLPVLNEEEDLGALLRSLKSQDLSPDAYEVLVVDGGSTDNTRSIVQGLARDWPGLKLLDNLRRRSAPARNIGAWAGRGEYVLFIDGHCSIPAPGYLALILEVFEKTGAACLCRPQPLTGLSVTPWGKAIARARHSPLGHNPGSEIYGGEPGFTEPHSAGAAYRKSVFVALGGFDERFDACEDVEFNHRVSEAGFQAFHHPDLAVEYRPRQSLSGLWRQMTRYGRGRARLMARHPETVPWLLVIAALAPAALGLVCVLLVGTDGLLWALGAIALWALLLVVEGFRMSGNPADALRISVALMVVQAGLVAGFWRGFPEGVSFRHPPRAGIEIPHASR